MPAYLIKMNRTSLKSFSIEIKNALIDLQTDMSEDTAVSDESYNNIDSIAGIYSDFHEDIVSKKMDSDEQGYPVSYVVHRTEDGKFLHEYHLRMADLARCMFLIVEEVKGLAEENEWQLSDGEAHLINAATEAAAILSLEANKQFFA